MKPFVLCLLSLSMMHLVSAQTAPTLEAVGYTAPSAPLPVAPGQVLTLFVRGVPPLPDGSMRTSQATAVPLPTVLAGLSAHIVQTRTNLPLFAVRQESDCPGDQSNSACLLTSLRVQMPFDLQLFADLVLEVDGTASRTFSLTAISDNAHVLTTCDLTWDTNWAHSCSRVLFHGDGSQITEKAPARPGETIVVYVWGLGPTSPSVLAGEISPQGVVLKQFPGTPGVRARFLDGPLVSLTARPPFFSQEDAAGPGSPVEFSGLTPGQVGLYQLNIPVPQSFTASTRCGDTIVGDPVFQGQPLPANAILRITTIFVGTEEVGFCLQP